MAPMPVIYEPMKIGDAPIPASPEHTCCYPTPAGPCAQRASHAIYDGEPSYDHDTYACPAHLGDMLSDAPVQHVYRL